MTDMLVALFHWTHKEAVLYSIQTSQNNN